MSRRILVVATSSTPTDRLRSALAGRDAPDDVEIRVVAPASRISRLDWLTNAEDDARATAAEQAEGVAEALPEDVQGVETGDSDPVQAVEDALRTFPADEVVILRGPREESSWLEEGFADAVREAFRGPVSQVVVRGGGEVVDFREPPVPRPDPGPLSPPDPKPPNPDPGRPQPLDRVAPAGSGASDR